MDRYNGRAQQQGGHDINLKRIASPPLHPQTVYKSSHVSLTCRPAKALFVAGQHIDGILEVACSSDKIWLGGIAVELRGAEQLHSRDHAASQAFLQSDITFQSTNLPPSNAVIATSPSNAGFWPARKGVTRFPFSFQIPPTCPSSCKFGGNASVTYTLLATCQLQLVDGERQILTRRLEVNVVERWHDWRDPVFTIETSEAQIREKVQTAIGLLGGLGKSEGTIFAEAIIPEPLFYRGWEHPDGSLETDRVKGEICAQLSVKNCTSKVINGVKMSLLRRLKILPPPAEASIDRTLVIAAASAPRITEAIQEIEFEGREWEFPAGGDERLVVCACHLPPPEKLLSIRKTKLFEIHTLVKLSLNMGTFNKAISLELPIYVAHWSSLPQVALTARPRTRFMPPAKNPMRPASSQGFMRMQSPTYGAHDRPADAIARSMPLGSSRSSYSGSRSPFTVMTPRPQLPLQQHYPSSARPAPYNGGFENTALGPSNFGDYISFDPYAAPLRPSSFAGQPAPWHRTQSASPHHIADQQHAQNQFQTQQMSLSRSAPASSYFQMLAQQRSTPSPNFTTALQNPVTPTSLQQPGRLPRSMSADSPYYSSRGSQAPTTPQALPPRMRECLTDEEQARVLANASPAVYDVNERARTLQQHGNSNVLASPRDVNALSLTGRQRRQSMPSPPQMIMLASRPSSSESNSARPIKTPPLAPSSRFTSSGHSPAAAAAESSDQFTSQSLGLETIGEDGESQAGTIRLAKGTLPRSASHELIACVKAIKPVATSVDEEGNTSVSLLEGIAEQQGKEKQARNRLKEIGRYEDNILGNLSKSSNLDKTLPKPPATRDVTQGTPSGDYVQAKRRIFDVFPDITPAREKGGNEMSSITKQVNAPSGSRPQASRVVSDTTAQSTGQSSSNYRPVLRSSKSESLLALESRLLRPMSPPSLDDGRALALSPPVRTETTSPLERAISPVHIGNEGALRKKSSQLSLRRQARLAQTADQMLEVQHTEESHGQSVRQRPVVNVAPVVSAKIYTSSSKKAVAQSKDAGLRPSADKIVSKRRSPIVADDFSRSNAPSRAATAGKGRSSPPNVPARLLKERKKLEVTDKTSSTSPRDDSNSRPLTGPSKRHVSDPEKKVNALATMQVSQPRRQSFDTSFLDSGAIDKYGSARGGRGGRVTTVAKNWANLIHSDQAPPKVPPSQVKQATSERRPRTGVTREAKLRQIPKVAQARSDLPLTSEPPVPTKSCGATPTIAKVEDRRSIKTPPALAFVNMTSGKSPVFVKGASVENTNMGTASAKPATGVSDLRALIAKFSNTSA